MTRRRSLRLGRGRIAVATGIVAAAALLTPTVVPSTASWTDREWAHGAVGTSSFDCGTDADYTSTASSRFLGGSVAGIDLDDVATVRGVDVAKTGGAPATVAPATAPELGTGGRPFTQAFGNPLDVGLLGDVAGIDLTGLGVGLPAGSAGAVNQVATASGTGEAVAASGLVADSGGVLVTPSTPSGDLPDPASITLDRALPGITDVTDVGLDVGAVGASAQLAGCDAISEEVWGGVVQRTLATNLRAAVQRVAVDGGPAGLERDYGIASLDLRVDSPLVGALVTAVDDTVVQLDAAVDALGGQDGVLARAIDQGVLGVLGGLTGSLGLGTIGGTVAITGPDLAGAVAPLLAEPVQDAGGTLSLDLSAGSVRVDLAHLLGDDAHGLNDLPVNHEVVLDAVTLGALADRLGQVVDAWAAKVTTALTTALGALHVRIALAADLSAPLVLGVRVKIATLSIGVDTGVAALMSGQTKLSVGVALLGLDLGGLLGVVTGLATSLVNPLTEAVVGTLTTRLFALVGTLGTTLTTTIGGPVVRAVGTVLARLPGVLSLRVNVQQDLGVTAPVGRATTGRYTQTALRLSIADALVPGGLARIDLASAAVGPNSVPLGPDEHGGR